MSDFFLPTGNAFAPEPVLVYDVNAQGRAAHLGRVCLEATYDTTSNAAAGFHAFSIFDGTGTLSDPHGDQIALTFSGTSLSQGGKSSVTLTGAVTGGTGSFANATGTLAASGRELPHGKIQLTLTVNL